MNIKQWEIWDINFNPSQGQEIQKIRPAIVVSNQRLGKLKLKIVIPITDITYPKTWHIGIKTSNINGLSKDCNADCFQIKSISEQRFLNKRGDLEEKYHSHIQLGILMVLGIEF
jgi:mRNA interferase MazF